MQVHAEKTCDNHQRQRQRAIDSQNLHYLIGAIGNGRQIDIERPREQVALRLYQIHCSYQVVVHIAKIGIEIVTRETAKSIRPRLS